jgi:predicted O-methyltransferase YrrM
MARRTRARFGWTAFRFFERFGIHLTTTNYESPLPDTRELSDDVWARQSDAIGLDFDADGQLATLAGFEARYRDEYTQLTEPTSGVDSFYVPNGWFERVDAEILYCMVRERKPRRIIEVGGGFSSLVTADALLRNAEETDEPPGVLTTIEPYPNETLRRGFRGLNRLVVKKVQEVPLSVFEELQSGDFLFIDSSHVLKLGSDVQYEHLEIVPRVAKGVIVHIHDFFSPAEYPRDLILESRRFWNEQYLVQAFLAFNPKFAIRWASSYMHLRHPDRLKQAFSSYSRSDMPPSSLWVERVAD